MHFSDSQLPRFLSIGAIGWWNYDNQGDLAMLAILRQGLAPHRIVPIDIGFPAQSDTIHRLNRLDYVILGGGTLIPGKPVEPFDTFDRWASQLVCPLGVAGLGVDPIPEQYWPAVTAMLDRARFVYVRDRESLGLLHNHPKVQLAPDLTFAYPLQVNSSASGDAQSVPVCGVNLRRSASLDPAPWLDTIAHLPVKVRGIPLSSFGVWTERALLQQLDPQCAVRFGAGLYRGLDLMIGVAFHSILFAVQAAVPVIAVDYAPKVRNFMEDNGLTHYLLSPTEHHRLPGLVKEVLAERARIASDLRTISARLQHKAQQNLENVRQQIEQSGPCRDRSGPKVTVVVLGTGDVAKDERTLASCTSQTYENVEVTLIDANSPVSPGPRLQQALTRSRGDYLTWVDGGDWFARDALDCLVATLQEEPVRDMVYTDYYFMSEENLPIGHHVVPEPQMLFRRDVVGPCFLMKKAVLTGTGQLAVDMPLAAYDLWLRASSHSLFRPLHAPLFYSMRQSGSRMMVKQERIVRRGWRRTRPVWIQVLWRVIDTDMGDRLIVRPVACILRRLRRIVHAKRQ